MKNLLTATLYVVAGLIFVVGGAWISNKVTHNDTGTVNLVSNQIRPVVSCHPDRLSYTAISQNENQVVKLIAKRKEMSAANGQFVNSQIIITKNETKDSKVACGYLFVRAGTKRYGALQSWENVYINPNQFGGHILSKSAVSVNDGNAYSEYLFSLDKIQYWRSRKEQAILNADWASLLNVSPEVSFEIALNTNDNSGFIDELSIAYKCWDPTTGEENAGCKLSVKESKDRETTEPVQ